MDSLNEIAIQGFLFDAKSSFLKGSSQAPPKIREFLKSDASNTFAENGIDVINPLVIDKGDFDIESYFDIEKITSNHLKENGKILSLGGDHSITYPIVKAFGEFYPKIDILHIDAHADLYHEFEGDPYSHACPFARIMENKLANRLVQIGIRTLNTHQKEQAEKFNTEIFAMKDFKNFVLPVFENPLYISLDMDGFDPAFAPGVSHHEPGGLSSRDVINIFHQIDSLIIGADIVEYNPSRDVQDITGALAAKMMKELLGKMREG